MDGAYSFGFSKKFFYFIHQTKDSYSQSCTILSPSAVSRNAFLKDSLDLAAIIFPFISIIDIASISSLLDKTSSAIFSAALDVTTMMVSLTSCNKNYYYYYCHRQQRGVHITINCSRIKFIFCIIS